MISIRFDRPIKRRKHTDQIPFTGADSFLLDLEHETRTFHRASHRSQVVIELAPDLDLARCQERIQQVFYQCPILQASIRRSWAGLAGPYEFYVPTDPPPVPFYLHPEARFWTGPGTTRVPRIFLHLLNRDPVSFQNGEMIRFDVVPDTRSTYLAVTWLHMLFDGHGIELFLQHLGDDSSDPELDHDHETRSLIDLPPLLERFQIQDRWSRRMRNLYGDGLQSPFGQLKSTPQQLRYGVTRYSVNESERCQQIATEEAGFLTPMVFYLAVSIRVHHQLFERRGSVPDLYLVPVPFNLRPRNQSGPMFRTHVSFLWFSVSSSQIQPRKQLINRLAEQRKEQIKNDFPREMAIAMENLKYHPHWLKRTMMRMGGRDEMCSFFFSYTGDFLPDLSQMFGTKFRSGFHSPAVPPSPGSSMIWSVADDQLTMTHVYQARAIEPEELNRIQKDVRREINRSSDELIQER